MSSVKKQDFLAYDNSLSFPKPLFQFDQMQLRSFLHDIEAIVKFFEINGVRFFAEHGHFSFWYIFELYDDPPSKLPKNRKKMRRVTPSMEFSIQIFRVRRWVYAYKEKDVTQIDDTLTIEVDRFDSRTSYWR